MNSSNNDSSSSNASSKNGSRAKDQSDYNRGGLIVFIISMAVSLVVMAYVAFFSGGVDLKEIKEEAPAAATAVAPQAAAEDKPIDVAGVKDPWVSSQTMIARGHQVFKQNCVMCHGNEGKGDGPAGMALNPRPRNMVEGKWKKGGTRLGLFGVLQNGLPPSSMQSYKAAIPKNDRWALVHFVRSITNNKVADDDAEVAAKAPALD
jgi:mono/diheme cytochrome c family protein